MERVVIFLKSIKLVAGTIKDLGLIDFINSRLGRYEGETMSFQGVEFTPDMRKMVVNVKLFFDNLKLNTDSVQ